MINSEQAYNEIVTAIQHNKESVTVFLVNAESGDIQTAHLDDPNGEPVVLSYELVPGAAILIQFGEIPVPWPRGLTIVD